MGLTLSTQWTRFNTYHFLDRNLITPISEMIFLKEAFCGLPGTKLSKLKNLHSEVFTKIHWGRFMWFLNFAVQLDLTEEEWEQLFDFLVPNLTQIEETVESEYRWENIHLTSDLGVAMDCCPTSPTFRFERIFNRIRCVLACFCEKAIVQNSEFCDGEKAREYLPRPESPGKSQGLRCCVQSGKSRRGE